jgi:hypothetical protein
LEPVLKASSFLKFLKSTNRRFIQAQSPNEKKLLQRKKIYIKPPDQKCPA